MRMTATETKYQIYIKYVRNEAFEGGTLRDANISCTCFAYLISRYLKYLLRKQTQEITLVLK